MAAHLPMAPQAAPENAPLALRPSPQLGPARSAPPPPGAARQSAGATVQPALQAANAQGSLTGEALPAPAPWSAGSLALGVVATISTLGWLIERRRRLLLETEKDSVLWADGQPAGPSIVTTAKGLTDILPDSPDPAESARAIYVTAIGDTNSRREATLIDLHQLHGKLRRRRDRGDYVAAVLLLQQHLLDFRYTSPWVFLELRELYLMLERQKEWGITRHAFRHRFGQNAPLWSSASTADEALDDDPQLSNDFARKWPQREARMFVLRWLLGEHETRQKSSGPPLLGLGVYRDLMFLDTLLDEVMVARPQLADSLL